MKRVAFSLCGWFWREDVRRVLSMAPIVARLAFMLLAAWLLEKHSSGTDSFLARLQAAHGFSSISPDAFFAANIFIIIFVLSPLLERLLKYSGPLGLELLGRLACDHHTPATTIACAKIVLWRAEVQVEYGEISGPRETTWVDRLSSWRSRASDQGRRERASNRALGILRKSLEAAPSNPDASYLSGVILLRGFAAPNLEPARRLLERAASERNVDAAFELGLMLVVAEPTSPEELQLAKEMLALASEWLRPGPSKARALLELGKLHQSGALGGPDLNSALHCFERSRLPEVTGVKPVPSGKGAAREPLNFRPASDVAREADERFHEANLELARESAKKDMLSFLTHTLKNTAADGPSIVRRLMATALKANAGNAVGEQSLFGLATLATKFRLIDSLVDAYKAYVRSDSDLRQAWEKDCAGGSTPRILLATTLTHLLSRLIFADPDLHLERLVPDADFDVIRHRFETEVLPKEVATGSDADDFFRWFATVTPIADVEVSEETEMQFAFQGVKYIVMFSILGELILNAIKNARTGSRVRVVLAGSAGGVELTVTNEFDNVAQSVTATHGRGLGFVRELCSKIPAQLQAERGAGQTWVTRVLISS